MRRDWLEPLHDAAGMRAVDAWAIEQRQVPSLRLMEGAGRALAAAVRQLEPDGPVVVVCGKGNNGGDGLVAARHLAQSDLEVRVVLLWPAGELSADTAANLQRLAVPAEEVGPSGVVPALAGARVVIDAMLGTGFEGAPHTPVQEAIEAINASGAKVVAADMPSGVDASTGEVQGDAVRATVTVAFHAAKLGHRIAPGKGCTGRLRVADIGIPDGARVQAAAGEISEAVLELAPRRGAESSKFTSGSVLVVGGSRGLTGAVALASTAAIRAGAGYATAAVPAELEPIMEQKLTEVMTRGCPGDGGAFTEDAVAGLARLAEEAAAAFVLGPGLGRSDGAFALARGLAAQAQVPMVLDADGLNAHEGSLHVLARRLAPTVITPHAGELARLLGRTSEQVNAERLQNARDAAAQGRCVVVLKGDDTIVMDGRNPDHGPAVNSISSPALATAGTGDVLAGTIGALIARGLNAFEAACAGVVGCARAGVIAAHDVGSAESVIASDVIRALPRGLRA